MSAARIIGQDLVVAAAIRYRRFRKMGRPRKSVYRLVESCLVLDVNDLSARGCLYPGLSGICRWLDGNGGIFSASLRYKAGQKLHLSWRNHTGEDDASEDDTAEPGAGEGDIGEGDIGEGDIGEGDAAEPGAGEGGEQGEMSAGEVTEIIPIVYVPCRFGGSQPYFLCPGKSGGGKDAAGEGDAGKDAFASEDDAGKDAAGKDGGGKDGDEGDAGKDGASERDAGVGRGRRVSKLFLAPRPRPVHGRRRQQGYFLCRSCSRISYASQHEQPWQRASRRANKLRQRLGITGLGACPNNRKSPNRGE
jgi:hypothetical protein